MMRKNHYVERHPKNIWIEPTNMCNLRCAFCFHSNNTMTRPKGMMSFEMFKKIIDDIKSFKPRIILHHSGESFLHKDLCAFIVYAKRANLEVALTTNGTLIDRCDILSTGIDSLNISLAGGDETDYLEKRHNSSFELVKNKIIALAAKKHSEAIKTKISINVIQTKYNRNKINKFRKELRSLPGVDLFFSRELMDWSGNVDVGGFRSKKIPINIKFQIKRFLARLGICFLCRSVHECAGILWDGTIVPCCVDFNGGLALGNVVDRSFLEVWNGDKMQQLRRMLKSSALTKKHPVCGPCLFPNKT